LIVFLVVVLVGLLEGGVKTVPALLRQMLPLSQLAVALGQAVLPQQTSVSGIAQTPKFVQQSLFREQAHEELPDSQHFVFRGS